MRRRRRREAVTASSKVRCGVCCTLLLCPHSPSHPPEQPKAGVLSYQYVVAGVSGTKLDIKSGTVKNIKA